MTASPAEPARAKGPRWAIWLPLAIFLAFVGLVAIGLFKPADHTVRSRLIGKPMPSFDLPPAQAGRKGLSSATLRDGKVHLVNIFASWCIPCRVESPQLGELAKAGVVIEGISVRDSADNLRTFLSENGDPYAGIGADDDGQVQLALGSSGVPETYVVDGKGIIRYQHVGEIRADQLAMILQKLQEAAL
ncbi:DsbE family thiol:disulfide interchange protein [Novosphingobium sp. 1949]|uniref:DsbE family thiol:disulfide interchange protein n=1 Tax=Novosphingobium organovorum TaxID=2930092 RepID=A0ABT0B8B7_9SPHN|nr:DsbE family thiol:disulfide interchange protein [Novosphingobium organovorum]MCJ2181311.1 DsbE family thiol:disulfide interchange protein [Novosphingobium organovorum]